jgi:hypothetical protein
MRWQLAPMMQMDTVEQAIPLPLNNAEPTPYPTEKSSGTYRETSGIGWMIPSKGKTSQIMEAQDLLGKNGQTLVMDSMEV